MNLDNVVKYTVLDAITSETAAKDFANMVLNLGTEVSYRAWDENLSRLSPAVTLHAFDDQSENRNAGQVSLEERHVLLFASAELRGNSIAPDLRDIITVSGDDCQITDIYYYAKNFLNSSLTFEQSYIVQLTVVEKRLLMRATALG